MNSAMEKAIGAALAACGEARLTAGHPIGGGSINSAVQCELDDGRRLFAKYHPTPPENFFQSEAVGLAALTESGCVRVPAVAAVTDHCLVLEYIEAASPAADYWETFGRAMAALHRREMPCFGFETDNYCGLTPQPNPRTQDGYRFYREHRFLHQARLAEQQRLLKSADRNAVEALCERLPELVPDEPPCLIHGDMWQGNLHSDDKGQPVLIDPACYWGWREADLAMGNLFGRLPPAFYGAYNEVYPLQPGWEERIPLFNLYHLLNHLNLFGGGYLSGVREVLKRFKV